MGDTPQRGFAVSEFEARLTRAQRLMAAEDLAGLLLTTEPEVRYFTGFQTLFWQSPARPWFVFIPAAGKPIAVIPEIGAALMQSTWVDDVRTWSAPAPHDDGISLLTELLSPLAARGCRLGVLKGPETLLRMPLGDYERLIRALPGLQICDATPLVRQLRLIKSAAEIDKIAHACTIAGRAFEDVRNIARPGVTQIDVFREFRRAALAHGADDVPYLVGGAGLGGYADVISPPDDRPLRPGDVLMLDTGCVWDGYYCDFDRNFALGQIDGPAAKAYEVLQKATEAGLDAARPGARCDDVFWAMQRVIAEVDASDGNVGRLGHGLGMQLTEWPSLADWDKTELSENMVITLEPSLSYGAKRMMVHEENIVVQVGKPRLLTMRAPFEMPVL